MKFIAITLLLLLLLLLLYIIYVGISSILKALNQDLLPEIINSENHATNENYLKCFMKDALCLSETSLP
jgi:hypothetical protein